MGKNDWNISHRRENTIPGPFQAIASLAGCDTYTDKVVVTHEGREYVGNSMEDVLEQIENDG